MSFASETKKELTWIHERSDCQISEFAAVVSSIGVIVKQDGRLSIVMETENVATARRIYTQLKEMLNISAEVVVRRKMRLKKNHVYGIRLSESQALSMLEQLSWRDMPMTEGHLPFRIPPHTHTQALRAYLRGIFLAAGSVNAPGSSSYHLEVQVPSQEHAKYVQSLLNSYQLNAKFFQKKKAYIVYLKEGEKIVDFLSIIGAHQALLKFEDTRILKGMRNQVNRLVNCETANMNKTISAAVRQLESIRRLEATVGLSSLPDHLREAAELRLRYPEANLQELCSHLHNRVSKSGLNHRFRKLIELADQIQP